MSGIGEWWYKLILEATDKGYPDIVHLPHTLVSITSYRQWRKQEGQPAVMWLYDLVMSYWSHSQAGGAVTKGLLLGWNNMSWMTNPRHLQFHVLGYLLTYWSPRNFIDRMVATPRHPLRLFCVLMDTLDANTSTCALIDVGYDLHPRNNVLPYVLGITCFQSGAVVRWMEARLRGKDVKGILAAPGSGVTKGLLLAFLWSFLRHGQKRNRNLVVLNTIITLLDVLQDAFGFDVYENAHKPLLPVLKAVQTTLSLGDSK